MKIVVDTNVLVSGLLSPYGAAGEVLRMAVGGSLDLLYDARIIAEYEEVLSRPKFAFEKTLLDNLMEFIESYGIPVAAAPLSIHLPDPGDAPFLEVAISGKAECLVTGNTVHYPQRSEHKMRILTPRQFLNRFF